MFLSTHPTQEEASSHVASQIIARINTFRPTQNRKFILCLPTGGTPFLVYRELARRCEEGEVSFEHVITINLDEYVGLGSEHPQSYCHFMEENLDIPPNQSHLLPGHPIPPNTTPEHSCASYESLITSLGGIHLLFMGIGENGHIGFNEPGSSFGGRTRVIKLDEGTRGVNARFFDDPSEIPTHALTMGIGTIREAREMIVLALGKKKAEAVRRAVEDGVNHLCPASALQLHENVRFVTDNEASQNLRETTKTYLMAQVPAEPSPPSQDERHGPNVTLVKRPNRPNALRGSSFNLSLSPLSPREESHQHTWSRPPSPVSARNKANDEIIAVQGTNGDQKTALDTSKHDEDNEPEPPTKTLLSQGKIKINEKLNVKNDKGDEDCQVM
uniref:Glucosamine-6-phosphate isomerase n=1 Tax=Kwoniella bestiolae CBS 10118 TaxID=1296100 RepID=A0A1B9GAW2_9TREE|nr:glucosamine-6-phosphate deaminase [Kwoniella bestiolae CBS 10118]OCF28154.1 glucosamine-6-phosphate deaminase [Kwoniella bestiolae CBS 10118]